MAFYGTYVLARSATLLPHVPGMRSAFGSRCMLLTRHQEGWQLAGLMTPMHHEWPAIHGGPVPLAIATGTPVLAVEIKESYCLQYGGATPDGRLWLAHFARAADNDKDCIFDHHDDSTVPLPAGVDVLRPLPGRPPAGADEFIRFLDRVADSMFGGGLTRAELRAEAARLLQTYPQP